MQCTAKARTTGIQCRREAVPGRGVCYLHGGRSLRGIASPRFVHGRYSRDIPTNMISRYKQSMQDGDLLILRQEISLMDARVSLLLKQLGSNESGENWENLKKTFDDLVDAVKNQNRDRMRNKLNAMKEIIDTGAGDNAIWKEINITIDQRRKLVADERKRLVDAQQMITIEQAMIFVSAVMDSVRTNVKDRTALAAITNDLTRLMARETPMRVEALQSAQPEQ